MIGERSVRWRMTFLFCLMAGALLAVCYAGFYFIFQRVLRDQFDRRLTRLRRRLSLISPAIPRIKMSLSSISPMSTSRCSTPPEPFCSAPGI